MALRGFGKLTTNNFAKAGMKKTSKKKPIMAKKGKAALYKTEETICSM